MTKAVLTSKVNPAYDDLPEERYHFPSTYLNQIRAAIGDWIVFYEPRRQDIRPDGRGGRQSYFAAARIVSVDPDSHRPDHFYARMSDYLEFDRPVPFRETHGYYENALLKPDGSTNKGAFGRAVRPLPDHEYEAICAAGFSRTLMDDEHSADSAGLGGFAEDWAEFQRPIVEQLVSRRFRDASFRSKVRETYNSTCLITGMGILNGGGRPEIEAAHIRPVGDGHNGPDSIRNGIALCRTVHWMFDRALISFTENFELMVSKDQVPNNVRRLFLPNVAERLPKGSSMQPHPTFLEYHIEQIFKRHTREFDILR